jgi:hypothetical protein
MREITRKNYTKNRELFILDKCKDKRVLHLGCCSSPNTEFKFGKDIALFQRIEKVCKVQQGLDIDRKEIKYLNDLGYNNISFFDLNQPGEIDFKPEIIVFADTLEHLMNLEVALSSLRQLMNENTELIVTVPNATMLSRVIGNFRGVIKENTDHKVSFTYSALMQLLEFNKLKVNNIYLAGELNIERSYNEKTGLNLITHKFIRGVYNIIYKPLINIFPLFSECLIITCSRNEKYERTA